MYYVLHDTCCCDTWMNLFFLEIFFRRPVLSLRIFQYMTTMSSSIFRKLVIIATLLALGYCALADQSQLDGSATTSTQTNVSLIPTDSSPAIQLLGRTTNIDMVI